MTISKPILVALAFTGTMAYANTCEQAIDTKDKTAVAICEQTLLENPNDDRIQYLTAIAYDMQGDFKTAANLYGKSAEQGNAKAQYALGTMYDDGQGVKRDYQQAFEWYQKSAQQGHPEAQFNLAVMYRKGYGVKKDKAVAKEWFGKACDSGIQDACSRR